MLRVQTRKPDSRLDRFVRLYVQRETRKGDLEIVEPVVARLGAMLEFQFARPYEIPVYGTSQILTSPSIALIGPITYRRVRLVIGDEVQALAILFQPQGLRALLGIPTSLVTDLGVDASGILGGEVKVLYERLGNAATFSQRVNLLNTFLLQCHLMSNPLDQIHHALDRLMVPGARIKVADIARQAGVTVRQLERRSLEYTGVSPKALVRIARFQQVLKIKSKGSSNWVEVAHALDYYDQMHMIRDFRALAGDSPIRAHDEIQPEHLISF